jgi:hypothetical protein
VFCRHRVWRRFDLRCTGNQPGIAQLKGIDTRVPDSSLLF